MLSHYLTTNGKVNIIGDYPMDALREIVINMIVHRDIACVLSDQTSRRSRQNLGSPRYARDDSVGVLPPTATKGIVRN